MKIIGHRLAFDDGRLVDQMLSPNHGGELTRPRLLVMHYTAGRNAKDSARWLCSDKAKASAHLVIGRDGLPLQLVGFDRVAWHAGKSEWQIDGVATSGINHHSIGIELDNAGRLVRAGTQWRSISTGVAYDAGEVIDARHKNEVHNSGWHVYPSAQLDAALEIARVLVDSYGLTDVVGHDDIAPRRKSDPGPAFPMEYFRVRLFGRGDGEA